MKFLEKSDPKTKEYLERIGEVIVSINYLESLMEILIWELIGASGDAFKRQLIGRRITYDMEFVEKADLLRSLIVERYGEDKAKQFTEDIYKNLIKCAEKRNDIAHSLWSIQHGTNKTDLETVKTNIRKAFEKGKKFNFSNAQEKVQIEKFDEVMDLLDKTSLKLVEFGILEK